MTSDIQTKRRKVGIIGAMTSEMDAIKAMISNPQTEEYSGITFVKGQIHGVDVIASTSGIGKVFAAMCAQTLILKYQPDLVINIGVSGSLHQDLNIGDIAIADAVVQHDMDTTAFGDPPGLISGLGQVQIRCSEDAVRMLEECAERLNFHHRTGIIASGDVFMQDRTRKHWVADTFQAISCEMEGASIGQVCCVNKVPFCILRAISDNGDETAGNDYSMSLEMAADRATQVMDGFLEDLGNWQKIICG